jgi:outer membrane immunogenic protein
MCRVGFAWLAAAGLILGSGQIADAADMRVKPVYKAPPPAMTYNWSGFYIGGHIGGAWAHTDAFDPVFGIGTGSLSSSRFIGGGQVGLNWQTGPWVLGVEAQASWTRDLGNAFPITIPAGIAGVQVDRLRRLVRAVEFDYFGTVAGRVGYAWDRWLAYVKGGGAWVHTRYESIAATWTGTQTDTRWGWMVGAGLEYAFLGNWSAKLEYNYMDFGTHRVAYMELFPLDIDLQMHVVKAGINYRFGGPLVARY